MLYLIGGENVYKSNIRLDEIKKDALKNGDEVKIYNADEILDLRSLFGEVDSFSLLSTRKLIIVKRIFSLNKASQDIAADFIGKSSDLNIVFWEDKLIEKKKWQVPAIDKRSRLYKIIKQKGIIEEFNLLSYSQIKSWVQNYIRAKGKISSDALELLILKIGNDELQLKIAIDNLFFYVDKNKRNEITAHDIEKLIDKSTEESIWEFLDCLTRREKGKAMEIMESLLIKETDFAIIISMITRQLRILALAKMLMDEGVSVPAIISKLRLHPFVARKIIADCPKFTIEEIKKLYDKLVRLDLIVKEGRFEEKLGLDLFIAAI